MATIPVIAIRPPGTASPINGTPSGDQFQNDGRVQLNVQNIVGRDIVVTIPAQRQPGFPLGCDDITFTVPANDFTEMYKIPPQWFCDPAGYVQLRYPVVLTIDDGGVGYVVGDELTVVGGSAIRAARAVVLAITGGGIVSSIGIRDAGVYNSPPASPAATSAVALDGSVSGGSGAMLAISSEALNLTLDAVRNPDER